MSNDRESVPANLYDLTSMMGHEGRCEKCVGEEVQLPPCTKTFNHLSHYIKLGRLAGLERASHSYDRELVRGEDLGYKLLTHSLGLAVPVRFGVWRIRLQVGTTRITLKDIIGRYLNQELACLSASLSQHLGSYSINQERRGGCVPSFSARRLHVRLSGIVDNCVYLKLAKL
jgi:hypothetical protein